MACRSQYRLILLVLASFFAFSASVKIKSKLPANGDYFYLPALENEKGDTILISADTALSNQLILIEFWASSCARCVMLSKSIQEIAKDYQSKEFTNGSGLSLVTVSLDKNPDAWKNYLKAHKYRGRYNFRVDSAWQSQSIIDAGISYLPYTFVLNPKGEILFQGLFESGLRKNLDKYLKK
jgi:thiol-disulfide isomerase/thioredoxin